MINLNVEIKLNSLLADRQKRLNKESDEYTWINRDDEMDIRAYLVMTVQAKSLGSIKDL